MLLGTDVNSERSLLRTRGTPTPFCPRAVVGQRNNLDSWDSAPWLLSFEQEVVCGDLTAGLTCANEETESCPRSHCSLAGASGLGTKVCWEPACNYALKYTLYEFQSSLFLFFSAVWWSSKFHLVTRETNTSSVDFRMPSFCCWQTNLCDWWIQWSGNFWAFLFFLAIVKT